MKHQPSVMNHSFSQVPKAEIQRSQFNRSHGYKTTFDAGYLIPVFVDEALPGDTFNLNMTTFSRLATPVTPFMDNLFVESFFFAVPIRLIWDNFQRFMGEQIDPEASTDFLVPEMFGPASTGHVVGSLSDYFGIPTGIVGIEHSSLWHRAYALIWNEWFRDQNLQDRTHLDKDDGPDTPSDYPILKRGKRHDYFTSCLPWPQKGDAVEIPLGLSAPVIGIGTYNGNFSGPISNVRESTGSTRNYALGKVIDENAADKTVYIEGTAGSSGFPKIFADLSTATASTINSLREAFQLQKLFERDARGGTRYTELVRSHFLVVSPDARLQRPEYLGGGSSRVNVSPIPQTSSTDTTSPQGNLAAMGILTSAHNGFTKSFTEHCIIIGMVCARADLSYQQGLNRMFSRRTKWDFYWPALAHLGEQAVLNKEIYAQGTAADTEVFGYQERFAEYRYKPSLITGKFRSTYATSLDVWHLAQEFSTLPELNEDFIEENPPLDRVIAVPAEPHFLFDAYIDLKCARPMPTYSVPGLIDHF